MLCVQTIASNIIVDAEQEIQLKCLEQSIIKLTINHEWIQSKSVRCILKMVVIVII